MIAVSIILGLLALVWPTLWPWAAALFVIGWALQSIGHWIERKPPDFLSDPRFLLVGTRGGGQR